MCRAYLDNSLFHLPPNNCCELSLWINLSNNCSSERFSCAQREKIFSKTNHWHYTSSRTWFDAGVETKSEKVKNNLRRKVSSRKNCWGTFVSLKKVIWWNQTKPHKSVGVAGEENGNKINLHRLTFDRWKDHHSRDNFKYFSSSCVCSKCEDFEDVCKTIKLDHLLRS